MDKARGYDVCARGTAPLILALQQTLLTFIASAPSQISHGKSSLHRKGASTGTIARHAKAYGRCPRSTKTPWNRTYLHRDLLRRKCTTYWVENMRLTLNSAFVAGGGSHLQQYHPQNRERDEHGLPDRPTYDRSSHTSGMDGFRGPTFVPQAEPDYSSLEEAEAAFMKLLKRAGVEADWTWEEAMRATITDPQYRSIKDAKDRKLAFDKYIADLYAQEKDKEKDRQAKLRSDFMRMLRSHPEIKYYTRWKTARDILEAETIFKTAKTEAERISLFREYRNELYKEHVDNESTARRSAMDELESILTSLDLEPYTRWSEAQGIIQADDRITGDRKFRSLTKSDVLQAFERHIKALERRFNDTRQKQKNQKSRRERQARDSYLGLLKDLRSANKIKAGTKWMDLVPLIEDDPRYVAMLGLPGSTPLELFWDTVEEEERVLRGKRNDVMDVLDVGPITYKLWQVH